MDERTAGISLPPANEQGNIFTPVCHSVRGGGAIPACIAGGIPACLTAGGCAIPACLAAGGCLLPGCLLGVGGAWSGWGSAPGGLPGLGVPGPGGSALGGAW